MSEARKRPAPVSTDPIVLIPQCSSPRECSAMFKRRKTSDCSRSQNELIRDPVRFSAEFKPLLNLAKQSLKPSTTDGERIVDSLAIEALLSVSEKKQASTFLRSKLIPKDAPLMQKRELIKSAESYISQVEEKVLSEARREEEKRYKLEQEAERPMRTMRALRVIAANAKRGSVLESILVEGEKRETTSEIHFAPQRREVCPRGACLLDVAQAEQAREERDTSKNATALFQAALFNEIREQNRRARAMYLTKATKGDGVSEDMRRRVIKRESATPKGHGDVQTNTQAAM